MASVFISYAGENSMLACDVHQWLSEDGHTVFLAEHPRDGLACGEDWQQRLRDELRQVDAVVCLVSSPYLRSQWCRAEVGIAKHRRRMLLPIQAETGLIDPDLADFHHVDVMRAHSELARQLGRIDTARGDDRLPADLAAPGAGVGVSAGRIAGGAELVEQFTRCDEPAGRDLETADLRTWLNPAKCDVRTTMAVTGPPDAGKTMLVRYAAWKAKDLFSGGAVYVNMNGYAQYPQVPAVAEHVYVPLLRALGVKGWCDSADLDAGPAAVIYRRKMAEWDEQGRSVLVVLDDVSDFDQVRALLRVNRRTHRFMVLSRDADVLPELSGSGRIPLSKVEILDVRGAVTLLTDLLGEQRRDDQRLSGEPGRAEKVVRLCGRLAPAVRLVGAVLAERSGMPWVDELIGRLDAFHHADLRPGRGAFRLCWHHLNQERGAFGRQAADLLLLLSVNPGPDISTQAVAALVGTAEAEVRGPLGMLRRARLLLHHADADRWELPPFIRECVEELAGTDLGADRRQTAFVRLLGHYQERARHLAGRAGCFLLRHSRPGPQPGAEPPAGRSEVLAYFHTERANLLGCLRRAAERVHDEPGSELGERLIDLTDAMAGYLRNNGPWDTAEQAHRRAAHTAYRLGRPLAQAIALNDLGITCRLRGRHDAANQALQHAQVIFLGLGDHRTARLGQANTFNEMAIVANERGRQCPDRRQSHHEYAEELIGKAWELYCDPEVDDRIGMANSAKNRGVALVLLGRFDEAARWLYRSMFHYREIDDVLGVVEVCNHLGRLYRELDDAERALAKFGEAMTLMGKNGVGSLLEEARAQEGTGDCQQKDPDGGPFFEKALYIYSRIGADRDRDRVAAKLNGLRVQTGR